MAINTDMVGQTFGPFVRDYTFRIDCQDRKSVV